MGANKPRSEQNAETQRQRQLAMLYEQAISAFNANKMKKAIDWFDLLLALDANYKDAQHKCAEARDKLTREIEALGRLCDVLDDEQRHRAIELIKSIIKNTTTQGESVNKYKGNGELLTWLKPLVQVFIMGIMSFSMNILAELICRFYPALSWIIGMSSLIIIGTLAIVILWRLERRQRGQ